ncbi:unnamed protein product [Darwinula stevensoni]|uniref:Uncharacterized protein n=1 Tax=Darwinula stevensoni TaxID=69355 RepID=A0A7R9A5Z1_9CRUS|nr:unnamed protein product [Darwinula stevensoni]CAG0887614.1 unnamed protein product [Darwinula stevensoni]
MELGRRPIQQGHHHSLLLPLSQLMLKLETMHNVSKTSINIIARELDETMTQSFFEARQHVGKILVNEDCPAHVTAGVLGYLEPQSIKALTTTYLREKFYEEQFNLIEPVPIKLGSKDIYVGGLLKEVDSIGYIVPLLKSLSQLLSLEDVYHHVFHTKSPVNDGIMRDWCDGAFFHKHPVFSCNPNALSLIMSYDDIELVIIVSERDVVFLYEDLDIVDFNMQLHAYELLDDPPLPEFTSTLKQKLSKGEILDHWPRFISECGNFYVKLGISTKEEYCMVGKEMYKSYPCIELEGRHEWPEEQQQKDTTATQKESPGESKETSKRKAAEMEQDPQYHSLRGPKKLNKKHGENSVHSISSCVMRADACVARVDIAHEEKYQLELVKELKRTRYDMGKVKLLLSHTFHLRSHLLSHVKDGKYLKAIIDLYPCFRDGEFFFHEMQLLFGVSAMDQAKRNMEQLFHFLCTEYTAAKDSVEDMAHAAVKFQKSVSGRQGHLQLLTVVSNVEDYKQALETFAGESPRMVLLLDGGVGQITIVGDTLKVALPQKSRNDVPANAWCPLKVIILGPEFFPQWDKELLYQDSRSYEP